MTIKLGYMTETIVEQVAYVMYNGHGRHAFLHLVGRDFAKTVETLRASLTFPLHEVACLCAFDEAEDGVRVMGAMLVERRDLKFSPNLPDGRAQTGAHEALLGILPEAPTDTAGALLAGLCAWGAIDPTTTVTTTSIAYDEKDGVQVRWMRQKGFLPIETVYAMPRDGSRH